MRRRLLGVFVAVAVAAASASALLVSPARSATPSSGTVDRDRPEVAWSGTITAQMAGTVSGAGCQTAVPDPTCDFFTLTVGDLSDPPPAKKPRKKSPPPPPPRDDLRVSAAPAVEGDGSIVELDVYVYDSTGFEVARGTELGSDTIYIRDIPAGTYTIAVQSVLSTDTTSAYRGAAAAVDASGVPILDEETPCSLEGIGGSPVGDPSGVGLVGDPTAVVDGIDLSQRVTLDVLVLLDGVPAERAAAIFANAARSYEGINVELRIAEARPVSIATDDAAGMITAAKAALGGERPAGIDIVEVLTSKDIQQLGQTAVAGLADCIGGVAHDDRAFAVAEAYALEDLAIGPFVFLAGASANITAHEIGHLLGGQHHYANCVEGVQASDVHDDGSVEVSPCTLMFNSGDFLGWNFDTLNGRIARGSVVRYAQP